MFDRTITKSQILRHCCHFDMSLYHYKIFELNFQIPKFTVVVAVLLYCCIINNV